MIKATLHVFVTSIACALFNVDWLANFERRGNLIGLLEFQKTLSEILLTAGALQIPNSLGDKFSQWDSQNETLITHYEKKSRDHAKCFLFWENHVSLRIYLIEL